MGGSTKYDADPCDEVANQRFRKQRNNGFYYKQKKAQCLQCGCKIQHRGKGQFICNCEQDDFLNKMDVKVDNIFNAMSDNSECDSPSCDLYSIQSFDLFFEHIAPEVREYCRNPMVLLDIFIKTEPYADRNNLSIRYAPPIKKGARPHTTVMQNDIVFADAINFSDYAIVKDFALACAKSAMCSFFSLYILKYGLDEKPTMDNIVDLFIIIAGKYHDSTRDVSKWNSRKQFVYFMFLEPIHKRLMEQISQMKS